MSNQSTPPFKPLPYEEPRVEELKLDQEGQSNFGANPRMVFASYDVDCCYCSICD